jgi:hypothetical protein
MGITLSRIVPEFNSITAFGAPPSEIFFTSGTEIPHGIFWCREKRIMLLLILHAVEILLALGLLAAAPALGVLILLLFGIRAALVFWHFRASRPGWRETAGIRNPDREAREEEEQADARRRSLLLRRLAGAPAAFLMLAAAMVALYFLLLSTLFPAGSAAGDAWLARHEGLRAAAALVQPLAGTRSSELAGPVFAHLASLGLFLLPVVIWGQIGLTLFLLRLRDRYEGALYPLSGMLSGEMMIGLAGLVGLGVFSYSAHEALELDIAAGPVWVLVLGGLLPLLPGFIAAAALGRLVQRAIEDEANPEQFW